MSCSVKFMEPGPRLSINTTPDPRLQELAKLATAIHQAADNQQWDDLAALLPRFDAQARSIRFGPQAKAQLQAITTRIDEARQLAAQRRDEIGNLLNGLTGKR